MRYTAVIWSVLAVIAFCLGGFLFVYFYSPPIGAVPPRQFIASPPPPPPIDVLEVSFAGNRTRLRSRLPIPYRRPDGFVPMRTVQGVSIDFPDPPGLGKVDMSSRQFRIAWSGEAMEELLLQRNLPKYPPQALAQRIEGEVRAEFIMASNGIVRQVRIVRSAHPLLAGAVTDAMRNWVYKPIRFEGGNIEVRLLISVKFTLPRSEQRF